MAFCDDFARPYLPTAANEPDAPMVTGQALVHLQTPQLQD